MPSSALPRRLVRAVVLALVLLGGAFLAPARYVQAESPADWATPQGWFYTQAGPGDGLGFEVTDAGDIPFWTFFQTLGGVRQIGHPISNRWSAGPLTFQAFQKAVLQWTEAGGVTFLNVYDALSQAGRDPWLQTARGVPLPPDAKAADDRSFEEVLAARLELLKRYPEIERRWFRNDRWLSVYGLPVVVEDRGDIVVLRAQRAVFWLWRPDSELAMSPPSVTISHSGLDFRDGGMIPAEATVAIPDPILAGTTGLLAFLSNRSGAWNLWTMTPTGTELTQLTQTGGLTSRPNWSPDCILRVRQRGIPGIRSRQRRREPAATHEHHRHRLGGVVVTGRRAAGICKYPQRRERDLHDARGRLRSANSRRSSRVSLLPRMVSRRHAADLH